MDGRIALLGGPGSNAGAVRGRRPQALGTARLPLPGAPGDTARPGGAAVLGRLDDEGIDALLARQAAGRVPVHELHLYHRGGALARGRAAALHPSATPPSRAGRRPAARPARPGRATPQGCARTYLVPGGLRTM